ncbi:endothelin-1 [Lepisosteus oculatus]|uniref:endothelin-1 n=1 Tax=Lepisosteus oculatus TaxID=7918 RepID=UPI0035F52A5A
MELHILFSMMSLLYSGLLQTVSMSLSQETSSVSSAPWRHIRTKRCSCSTFLDKECVYFCHLDIIWINTPERTVSYGLGSAPRVKRALRSFPNGLTHGDSRCTCASKEDKTCATFCQSENLQRLQSTDVKLQAVSAEAQDCTGWQCLYNLAANKRKITRGRFGKARALLANVKLRAKHLLKKKEERRNHKSKLWESLMSAS